MMLKAMRARLKDLSQHFNFFRYHLLFFTITPIVFSGIFYAANGDAGSSTIDLGVRKVEYIDSLFLCFSAMTVTGLATVNISTLQPIQQVFLLILFVVGDFSFVSLIMVLVRKRFFRKHCEELLRRSNTLHRSRTKAIFNKAYTFGNKVSGFKAYNGAEISEPMDARPAENFAPERITESPVDFRRSVTDSNEEEEFCEGRITSGKEAPSGSTTAQSSAIQMYQQPTHHRTHYPSENAEEGLQTARRGVSGPRPIGLARQSLRARTKAMTVAQPQSNLGSDHTKRSPQNQTSLNVRRHNIPAPTHLKHSGMGGFPTPIQLVGHLLPEKTSSTLRQRFGKPERQYTLLLNRVETMQPTDNEAAKQEDTWDDVTATVARWMPEKLSGLVIGRNSRFYTEELDDEELEVIGGVEYRALRLLSYLVPAYMLVFQMIPFAVVAIYFSKVSSWDSAYAATPGVQQNSANKIWSSFFLIVSAYAGCGMSLIDQGLYPFSNCYLLIFVMVVVLLAGNHALPMNLRGLIWLGSKVWRKGEINETLHFLLDHPRRCFLYLFPSHQTWYLVLILVAFIATEMFGFLVLNIGLPILRDLGKFQMFADALFQSLSVRASGFGIVSISSMAPSVLFLYVILMYVAIYPIAMSVRSTNVYEEQALGVYEAEDPETNSESEPAFQGKKHEIFSKYLAWHVRRQLAFDIWPLTFAIFLICIVERKSLLDPETSSWVTVFRIIFECTSAYATIGLSLGTPNNNFSFSAELRPLSKIIMILVMLRGRHRGLPVAIDRAILLPHAFARGQVSSANSNSLG